MIFEEPAEAREISEAISNPVAFGQEFDEDELEAELNDLEAELEASEQEELDRELLKVGPAIYKWRVRRRLLYWYGRLKALEGAVADDPNGESFNEQREEVAVIDEAVRTIPVPLAFSDQYYTLRAAIDLVRQRLAARGAQGSPSLT